MAGGRRRYRRAARVARLIAAGRCTPSPYRSSSSTPGWPPRSTCPTRDSRSAPGRPPCRRCRSWPTRSPCSTARPSCGCGTPAPAVGGSTRSVSAPRRTSTNGRSNRASVCRQRRPGVRLRRAVRQPGPMGLRHQPAHHHRRRAAGPATPRGGPGARPTWRGGSLVHRPSDPGRVVGACRTRRVAGIAAVAGCGSRRPIRSRRSGGSTSGLTRPPGCRCRSRSPGAGRARRSWSPGSSTSSFTSPDPRILVPPAVGPTVNQPCLRRGSDIAQAFRSLRLRPTALDSLGGSPAPTTPASSVGHRRLRHRTDPLPRHPGPPAHLDRRPRPGPQGRRRRWSCCPLGRRSSCSTRCSPSW